ncbi:MAG: BMP family ABC transporter substrate-binding protein [Chloroflexota bacterium]
MYTPKYTKLIGSAIRWGFLAIIISMLIGCSTDQAAPVLPAAVATTTTPAVTPTATPAENTSEGSACSDQQIVCVGLISDTNGINDKAFNQSAWGGLDRARKDLLFEIDYVEPFSSTDYEERIYSFIEKDFDIIVTVGHEMTDQTIEHASNHPDIDFIGVDQFQTDTRPNVAGLIYPEKKAGFLAGVVSGMATKTQVVGIVLGSESAESSVRFKEGFSVGVQSISSDIVILASHHPGSNEEAFSDQEWGASTARSMLDSDADVIFSAAGETGAGALVEIAKSSNAFCIGAEADQYLLLQEARPCLLTSVIKDVESGVFELLAWSDLGQLPKGNFVGQVGLAPFHGYENSISAASRVFLKDVEQSILDNSILINESYAFNDPPKLNLNR